MAAAEEAPATDAPKKKKFSGKKLVLFILLPVLLLGGGGAAAYFLLLKKDPAAEEPAAEGAAEHAADEPQVYVALENPLQVNLVGTGKRMPYLNLDLWLAVKTEEDAKKLEGVMPKVVDQFQVYLRSLRIEDLQGADGVQRMRDELLLRAKAAAKPIEVEDVLIKSMLAQ
ncbi:flagellar basal body-associated FliL family protein [Dongia sp.]|uniref:flagellar basal body-associated FliL family protein n=1 Tax=Dongia sp. TaxID=1977262 RepID=UPI0037513FD3